MRQLPSLSVVCFTNDPPHRVAAALALVRDIAQEVVVAVDDRVDVDTLGPLIDVADRVVRAGFVPPLETNLEWLHQQATCDWVLRLDGDDVVSEALLERLSTPGWDLGVTHGYVSYRWLWGGPDQMLDQPPWWPDPALRLIRNIPGIARFPHGTHHPAEVAGDSRFFDESLYHLDLLLASEAAREEKADRYERDASGLRTDPGWSVNTTYYLPERVKPVPRLAALSATDAANVRAVLDAVAPSPTPVGELAHVTVEDRQPPAATPGDVALRVIAHQPVAVVHGRTYTITVGVTNRSLHTWRPDRQDAPQVGAIVLDRDGETVGPELRALLPGPVAPGEEALVRIAVPQFPEPGLATLDIGLIDGSAGWHDTRLDVALNVQAGRRVLVSVGAAPVDQLGTDCALTALMRALARHLPDAVPVVLTHRPGVAGSRFHTVEALAPWAARPMNSGVVGSRDQVAEEWASDLVAAARRHAAGETLQDPATVALLAPFVDACALVVLPGEGFSDDQRHIGIVPIALETQIAHALGLPVLVEAAFVGPIERRRDRTSLVRIARSARRFTVRDAVSAQTLRSLGAGEQPAEVVPDPSTGLVAAAVRDATTDARQELARVGVTDGRPYVVFGLRDGRDGKAEIALLHAVAERLPEGVATVYLAGQDATASNEVSAIADDLWCQNHLGVLGPGCSGDVAAALVAGATLVAGSQLALTRVAHAAGVPVVAFAADAFDATRLEAVASGDGVRVVPYGDLARAADVTTTLVTMERPSPASQWDGAAFGAALQAVLPASPVLA